MKVWFNRNEPVVGRPVERLSNDAIKATPGLWHASWDDALRYGGEVTRHVLGSVDLRGDRKHVIVDTKVHMLLPGFMPAIPGWHTDGVPRWDAELGWNVERGLPSIGEQDDWEDSGEDVAPIFHLYTSGVGCLTRFVVAPLPLDLPPSGDPDLYKHVTQEVRAFEPSVRVQGGGR